MNTNRLPRLASVEVIATFAVGFTDRTWITSGPYRGSGKDVDAAGADALSKCAKNQVRFRKEVEFVTFLGLKAVARHGLRIAAGETA